MSSIEPRLEFFLDSQGDLAFGARLEDLKGVDRYYGTLVLTIQTQEVVRYFVQHDHDWEDFIEQAHEQMMSPMLKLRGLPRGMVTPISEKEAKSIWLYYQKRIED